MAGKSLYEDMALVRKSQNDLRHVLLSKLPKDEIGNFCYLDGFSVSAVNAFTIRIAILFLSCQILFCLHSMMRVNPMQCFMPWLRYLGMR